MKLTNEHKEMLLDCIEILIELGTDAYNQTKCMFLYNTNDKKLQALYQSIYDYTEKHRPLLLEMK